MSANASNRLVSAIVGVFKLQLAWYALGPRRTSMNSASGVGYTFTEGVEELNVGPNATVFTGVQDLAAGFVIDQFGVMKSVSSAGASQTRSCSRAWILRSRYSIVR